MNEINIYEYSAALGFLITLGWVAAYILCWIIQWAWSWVDDSKVGERNKLVEFINVKVFGLPISDGCFYYEGCSDGGTNMSFAVFVTAITPLLMVLAFNFYPVTIAIITFVVIAWLARFARRHKKLFDLHVKDKDAHK